MVRETNICEFKGSHFGLSIRKYVYVRQWKVREGIEGGGSEGGEWGRLACQRLMQELNQMDGNAGRGERLTCNQGTMFTNGQGCVNVATVMDV